MALGLSWGFPWGPLGLVEGSPGTHWGSRKLTWDHLGSRKAHLGPTGLKNDLLTLKMTLGASNMTPLTLKIIEKP